MPRDPVRILLFMLMLMTVSRIQQHFGFLAQVRPALLLAIATLIYALMNPRYMNSDKLLRHWPARVMLGLGIMACLSVPFGLSVGSSAMFIITEYSKVLIFGFLLIAAMRSVQDLRLFIWAYVISCGILVWMAWAVFGLRETSSMARLSSLYTWDANDAGAILLVGLPLTILTMQTSGARGRIASLVILVGIGATLARTGSRGAFLGAIAVGISLLLLLKNVSAIKRLLFVVVAGSALVLTAPPGYWEQMASMTAPKDDYNWTSAYGRRRVWSRGIGYMMQNPLTGIGIHQFGRAEGTISDVAVNFVDRPGVRLKWSAPHNSFIEAGAETGIPGLILWSALVFGGIFSMGRIRRRLPAQWARGDPEQRFIYLSTVYLPIALIGFTVTAFFLSFAWIEIVYILAAYVIGVYVAVEVKMAASAPVAVRGPGRQRMVPAWRRAAGKRTVGGRG